MLCRELWVLEFIVQPTPFLMRALLRLAAFSGLLLTLVTGGPTLAQPPPVAATKSPAEVEYFTAQQVQPGVATKVAVAMVRPVAEAPRPTPAVVVDTLPAATVEGGPKFRGPPRLVGRKRKLHGRWYKLYRIRGKRNSWTDRPVDPGPDSTVSCTE